MRIPLSSAIDQPRPAVLAIAAIQTAHSGSHWIHEIAYSPSAGNMMDQHFRGPEWQTFDVLFLRIILSDVIYLGTARFPWPNASRLIFDPSTYPSTRAGETPKPLTTLSIRTGIVRRENAPRRIQSQQAADGIGFSALTRCTPGRGGRIGGAARSSSLRAPVSLHKLRVRPRQTGCGIMPARSFRPLSPFLGMLPHLRQASLSSI